MNKTEFYRIVKSAWDTYSLTPLEIQAQSTTLVDIQAVNYLFLCCIQPMNKTLLLGINRNEAVQLAASMFALPSSMVTDENLKDASAEILNIIAGNTKNSLSNQGSVGIPSDIDPEIFLSHYGALDAEILLIVTSNNIPIYVAIYEGDLARKLVNS